MAVSGGGSGTQTRELDQTPTWAVACVCTVIIIISITLEKLLHKVGTWFTKRQKKALYEALHKIKDELMILGFISLLLVFGQKYITEICIPEEIAGKMLPCISDGKKSKDPGDPKPPGRHLLSSERRYLAAGSSGPSCKTGQEPLISGNGVHQLHILIFFLAVFHVIFSAITMKLGRLKIRGWKQWEQEALSNDYKFSYDKLRFRFTHQTSFVQGQLSFWTRIPFFFYIGCFFRQFFRSVSRSDYLTVRNGFISVHLSPENKFDFQKYIMRSLEDDFKIVVGVSPILWASFVIFLLLNVSGWQALFWASLIPVIIILAVGTKLQAILTKTALRVLEKHSVIQGMPLVEGSDEYFWFGRPQLLLHLIHFVLFQNAFQITYFLWIWYSFRLVSCFHANIKLTIARIVLGYITLPVYALMGSCMKKSIFDEQTSNALMNWQMVARKKQLGDGGKSPDQTLEESTSIIGPSNINYSPSP